MSNREDYVGDKNPTPFLYAMDNNLLPQEMWKEPIPTTEDVADLADNAFANPYSREYPCHTKAACMLSAVWDASTGEKHPLVSANIRKHAAAHGVDADVNSIYEHFKATTEKSAAAEEVQPEPRQYALQISNPETNTVDGYFDVTYPHSVVPAAEEAVAAYRRGQLGDPLMAKVANSIVKAATAFAVSMEEIPQTIQVFGVPRLPDPYRGQVCVTAFAKQAGAPNVQDYTDTMLALQEMVKEAATVDAMMAAGTAASNHIYALNNANGIYPQTVDDTPHAIVFGGPRVDDFMRKAASCVPVANVPVPAEAIVALPETIILSNFSKEAAIRILQARQLLQGEVSMDKSAAASNVLASLTPEATSNFLRILSET